MLYYIVFSADQNTSLYNSIMQIPIFFSLLDFIMEILQTSYDIVFGTFKWYFSDLS